MRYLSREETRALDRRVIDEFAVPGIVLMENAGRGIAGVLLGRQPHGRVVICAGKGNNAGDGFVAARHLDNAGVAIRILTFEASDSLTGDASTMYRILERSGLAIRHVDAADDAELRRELMEADWLVDALFGTGLRGPVRPPYDRVITAMNGAGRRVLAVDIPSGLDCDQGLPQGPTIRADVTATLLAAKKGFANPEARAWLGELQVLDIGAPRAALA